MGCSSSRPAPTPARAEGSGGAIEVDPMRRLKLVLLGDSGVGKSCLVLRYVRGAFDPSSKVTVGAAFMSHSLSLPDGKSVKFEIWDTAGQERYASLAPLYYRGASAAIVVYDITSKESFAKAKHWISELHKNASGSIVIVLVGNKTDLVEQREVFEEEGKELADRHGMLFIETSAKTAANCALVFESIAKKLSGSGYLEPDTPATPTQTPGSQSGSRTPAIPASHVPSPETSSKAPPN